MVALAFYCCLARAETTVRYIANAGVMVTSGDSKILFDPLFDNDYGQYYLPPADVRAAILSGESPFDDVDAVFISHAHADHFTSGDILTLLRQQPSIQLYGSTQVSDALKEAANGSYTEVFSRVSAVALDYGDSPVSMSHGALTIDAVRIPHSGWPDSRQNMQNIAFRVSLQDGTSVLHLGDADVSDDHYALHAEHWNEKSLDLALPPYWYFLSPTGRAIIGQRLKPGAAIGVHVPDTVADSPAARQNGLRDVTLFTRPGEIRTLGQP